MRNFATVLSLIICLAGPSIAQQVFFSDDFEDGDYLGWTTWTSSGTINNVIDTGFAMSVVADPYGCNSPLGLHLHNWWTQAGANTAEAQTLPGTGEMCFRFDVRPYYTGGINNGLYIALGEVSGLVSQTGFNGMSIAFRHDGEVHIETPSGPEENLGSYTVGEWCHVEIQLNTFTDLFSVQVSGTGVSGILSGTDIPFKNPFDTVNFLHIQDDGIGPNDHGLDNVYLSSAMSGTEASSWGAVKALFR